MTDTIQSPLPGPQATNNPAPLELPPDEGFARFIKAQAAPAPLEEPPYTPLEEPNAPSAASTAAQSLPGASTQVAPQGAQGSTPQDQGGSWLHQTQQAVGFLPDAVGAGALKGVFEAKDFLTGGETPPDQCSAIRQYADSTVANENTGGKLISGISQFAIGMLGAGKLASIAKAAPLIGEGVAAAGDLL